MFHCILVKFLPSVKDRQELTGRIQEFFSGSGDIPGIRNAALYPSAVDRPNRYDLMIQLDMDRAGPGGLGRVRSPPQVEGRIQPLSPVQGHL